MNLEEKNLLIRKRYSELDCLGIEPKLYYSAVKLINLHVFVVVKDSRVYIFKKEDNYLHESKDKGKYYESDKITQLLVEAFGVDKTLAYNIYSEWIREKIIYARMSEDSNKYWEFLTLPIDYIEISFENKEFNFNLNLRYL